MNTGTIPSHRTSDMPFERLIFLEAIPDPWVASGVGGVFGRTYCPALTCRSFAEHGEGSITVASRSFFRCRSSAAR